MAEGVCCGKAGFVLAKPAQKARSDPSLRPTHDRCVFKHSGDGQHVLRREIGTKIRDAEEVNQKVHSLSTLTVPWRKRSSLTGYPKIIDAPVAIVIAPFLPKCHLWLKTSDIDQK